MSTPRVEPGFRFGAAFLAAGIVVTGGCFALPGGAAQSVVDACLGGTAAIALPAGVRLHRPRAPVPWLLFALATALFVAGDVAWDLRPSAAAPSVADWCRLAGYPVLAAALLMLLVHAGGRHRIAALGEAGIAAFAFALVLWVFFVHPALDGSGTLSVRIVDATFPAGDVVLLAGFAGFFVSAAWRTPAFLLLVAAVGAALIGDGVYGRTPGSYVAGSWVDATWLVSYVLFGTAALHPSMRRLSEPRRVPQLRVSASRIVLLTAALLSPATILLVQWARGARLEIPAVFAATALISLLVVWRLAGILRALERLRARERESRAEAVAAHELLTERNERLLEADRLKDEFVALISHDLRTPLTSIIGYTELALDETDGDPLDAERKSYLSVVARSAERLLRLVDDLLFVARLRAGRGLELDVKELDLAAIAQQSAVEAHPRAQAKHLELRYEGVEAAPVRADRGRMFQLLDNLIANAIKFTPAGGRVAVHVETLQDTVVLEVRDTGIGMSPEDAEQLFERFFRSERASTVQIPGTGLGLFVARAITEAHRGRIPAAPGPRAARSSGSSFRLQRRRAPAATRRS